MARIKKPLSTVRLTLRNALIIVAAGVLGIVVLEIVPLVALLWGGHIEIDGATRTVAALFGVSLAIVIETPYTMQELLREHQRQLSEELATSVKDTIGSSLTDLFRNADAQELSQYLRSAKLESALIGILHEPIASLVDPLKSGVVAWMGDAPAASYLKSSRRIQKLNSGVLATPSQQVAVTRALFDASDGDYLQINLAAIDPEQGWTENWQRFLKEPKKGGRNFEYIVLGSEEYLLRSADHLRAMRRFLGPSRVVLKTCTTELVVGEIGVCDLDRNVEVFGDKVIKLHGRPDDETYRNGKRLRLSLVVFGSDAHLQRTIQTVRQQATVFH